MTTETQVHDINLNAQECLHQVGNIGSTTYQNICNGATAVVPWGSADWLGFVVLAVIVSAVIFVFGCMVVSINRL